MKRICTLVLLSLVISLKIFAAFHIGNMEVEHLSSPLGIDTPNPQFSWQLASDERGCLQVNYQIVVTDAEGTEVWNSGVVDADLPYGVIYAGAPLCSKSQYQWTLSVTDNRGRKASSQATFETAFLTPDEWEARWIGRSVEQSKPSMEILLDTLQHCRYLRLRITKLGTPVSTDPNYTFVQLDEMEIYAGDENVALGATFKASSSWGVGNWHLNYINDGRIGDAAHLGWTTTQNPSTPIVLNIDLGREVNVDRVVLYPRQDDHAKNDASKASNFPASFSLQTSLDNSTYVTAYAATNVPAPTITKDERRIPYLGRHFEVDRKVKRARIYATALGVFTLRINGQPVTDAVLEPGESEYEESILYSTYDVTSLLQQGRNTLLAQVAGGIYNIDYLDGRYSKGEVRNNGTSALLCELYVEYDDGEILRVVTDEAWRMTDGPTLGSNWWGGEDYDARLRIEGVDGNEVDMDAWQPVELVTPHFESPHSGVSGHGVLRSRMYEPLRVVEQWQAVDVKTITSGGQVLRMVDFGRNFAGQYRFKLKGRKGQKISLRCGESLNPDGSIAMQNYYTGASDTYDVYTFRGDEEGEEWGPEFMYHGFRYLQIIGLSDEPQPEAFTALRIRSDVDNIGAVHTGNTLINDIHILCRDAIASQLYNSITDCPQREKLGWLDVPNEMYVSLASNFDMQNFYKKVVLDCFDAQQPNGMVPSVSPYYMTVYVDDVNWGGAAILVPYRNWRYYGDASLMTRYYDQMKHLMDHYTANTTGYIINNHFSVLSDWGQETAGVSPMVPTEFTETTTYYYLLCVMAEIAHELGHTSDAAEYHALAAKVKDAFNAKFYNSTTATYTSVKNGGGRQSEQAMPLYYGLVPEGDEARVAAVLAQRVISDGYKIRTGEIALKPLFVALSTYGYNDIVWQMSLQTDCPSYGYWVEQGYTTTPEYWDVGAFSQNHCMMDHIEEWFYTYLGGIQNRGMAFREFDLRPFVPANLDSCHVATRCSYGAIRSSWQRIEQGIQYHFTIPAGTEARIVIPVSNGQCIYEDDAEVTAATKGVVSITYEADTAIVVVGSGDYRFYVPIPAAIATVKSDGQDLSAQTARWITADHALRNAPNTWIEFRKTLTLSEAPQQALAHIAADTKYWLWVGDSLIVFEGGLKRGPNPRDTYYDVVDLAPFLTVGDNHLRVLLWHFGKPGFSHVNSGESGFILNAPTIGLYTDRTWQSQRLNRYQTASDPQPNWRLAESSIRYDARLEQQTTWAPSLEVGLWGSAPWNGLVERPIPQWKDYGIRQLQAVTTPGTTKAQLPYNAQFTPVIDITDPVGGTLITIETDHVRGGGDNCVRAEYITRPGRQQYESLGWMNGDVLYLRYPSDAPIEVHSVGYRETGYDAEFLGRFSCSDEFLNRFRDKAMRTLYVNMRDTYFDCPDRERAQWWGDVTILMNESFYQLSPAANLLTRKAMRELVDWQRADSTLFSPIPAQNYSDELPAQMLAAISTYGFWAYYLHTGDAETMHYVYPAMKRYLGIWQLDATGLTVERTGGWSWGDWGSNIDIRLILAGWHYLALQSAINVAQLTGNEADIAHYEHTMQQIKTAYNLCWNGKAYRHPTYTGDTDDRVQALAVVSGIAEADKYKAIYKLFTTQWHASPYMETYVMEALMQMGYGSYALRRFKTRFASMVNSTTHSTLFEGWEEGGYGGGSTNHAWSGGMLTIIAQYLCGIKPTAPAWDTYTVAPNPLIAECSIEVPTVKGSVCSTYTDDDERFTCTLSVPHATRCTFVVPHGSYTCILIDGKRKSSKASYTLTPGEHTIVCVKRR